MTDRKKLSLKSFNIDRKPKIEIDKVSMHVQGDNSLIELKKTIRYLEKKYPDIFNYKNPQKVLKIGFLDDIVMQHKKKTKNHYRKCLGLYVNTTQYQQLIINSSDRYDLTGAIAGQVSQSEKMSAISKHAEIVAKRKLRKIEKK